MEAIAILIGRMFVAVFILIFGSIAIFGGKPTKTIPQSSKR
jgi:hypothetical protein